MPSTQTMEQVSSSKSKNTYLYPGMKLPFILLILCFISWGIANNMTDPLVKVFSSVFTMSTLQSSLVQLAFYGAYFLLAIPAAYINTRLGYKGGVLLGLGLAALGGFMFIPAAYVMTFSIFVFALFTLAAGCSILETSANPFVLSMGPEKTATRRLNFVQSFNPVGSNLGVFLAATLILPNITTISQAKLEKLNEQELIAIRAPQLQAVMGPYVGLALLLVAILVGIALVKIPGSKKLKEQISTKPEQKSLVFKRLWNDKLYSFGVVAQFANIAAQIAVWTYTLHYVKEALGVHEKDAGWWLQASLIIFLVARFLMVALMGKIDARLLMAIMTTLGAVLCVVAAFSSNIIGCICVISLSACLSLLFPTIYAVALKGLTGDEAKYGAGGLVMAIVGGATIPLIQARVIDISTAAISYLVPGVCFLVCLAYAIYALKNGGKRI